MLLNTPIYLLFLLGFAIVYWLLPIPRWRVWLLFAGSYVFCATFDLRFAAILFALTVLTYLCGRAIVRSPGRLYVTLGVLLNLGALAIFKYANFFLDNVQGVLHAAGADVAFPALQLLLPIGISFYTFQGISYIMELSRGKLPSDVSFVDFAVYLAFFPKLIAGPFVRPQAFFQQVAAPTRPDGKAVRSALQLLLLGLVKKVIIADSLGALADAAFRAAALPNSGGFPTLLYWQGFYLFAFEIYADFSGYTDLARGSALLLGFALPENFKQPYFATTLGDFWNRWHMSLTAWFREYLFFPLSRALLRRNGGRNPRQIQILSNLITMVVIGLWHGAAWTFIGWGLWHGVLLSGERMLNVKPTTRWQKIAGAVITFHLVGLGWIMFQSPSIQVAAHFVAGMFTVQQPQWWSMFVPPIVVTAILVLGLDWLATRGTPVALRQWQPIAVTAAVVVIVGLMLLSAAHGSDVRPFIYGRF